MVVIGRSLAEFDVPLAELEQFGSHTGGVLSNVAAASLGVVIPFGGVTNAKLIVIIASGLVALKLTPVAGSTPTTAATPQTVPCDGTYLTKSRNRAYTAITFDVGPANVDVQYLIAGD